MATITNLGPQPNHTLTLDKFGVPLDDTGLRGGILMPKVKHKFRVLVSGFGPGRSNQTDLTRQVTQVGRPNLNMNPVTLDSYNSKAYYAGKPEWEPVNLTVRDDVSCTVSSLIGHQVMKQQNFFFQTSPVAAADYKFQMQIQTLAGDDSTILEEWFLEGCFLATVNYEEFDYSSAEPMLIQMSIRYDNATQTDGQMPQNPNVPAPTQSSGLVATDLGL